MSLLFYPEQRQWLLFPLAKAIGLAFLLALAGQNLLAGQSIPDALLTILYYLNLSLESLS